MKRTIPSRAAIAADIEFNRPTQETKPVTTDLAVAYYTDLEGSVVLVNPAAAALSVHEQVELLIEAAEALTEAVERLTPRRQQ